MAEKKLPRGIRNNNPGNIRLSATRWQGQKQKTQADKDFMEFDEALMGLRALMRVLLTYYRRYDLDTVESIIHRWAPPSENVTGAYVDSVCKRLRVTRHQPLRMHEPEMLSSLAAAIVRHENGPGPKSGFPDWYPSTLYADAAKLALS